ncbi:MAG: hypothetical protein D6706_10875 [Chloroflexi bacterium]|nr:MAG: hypothetical protein D6706_10875 [Chloroflexota bacterium]
MADTEIKNPSPKDDCETLLDAVLPAAQHFLGKYGEFYPFGATLSLTHEVALVAAEIGEEHPTPSAVMALIENGFRSGAQRHMYRATALVHHVSAVPPEKTTEQNCIAVSLNHQSGYSILVVFPYTQTTQNKVVLEAPFAYETDNTIFGE